jgi:hypothetical protein
MGEELRKTELAAGGKPFQKSSSTARPEVAVDRKPTLAEIGITDNQSSRYQKLAAIPEETFEAVIEAHNLADEPISTAFWSVPGFSMSKQISLFLNDAIGLKPKTSREGISLFPLIYGSLAPLAFESVERCRRTFAEIEKDARLVDGEIPGFDLFQCNFRVGIIGSRLVNATQTLLC